jgi:hypothetical protein
MKRASAMGSIGVLLGIAWGGFAPAAHAGSRHPSSIFAIDSHSVYVDLDQRRAYFSLTFTRQPDFETLDEFNRPADSFQYEINPAFSGSLPVDGVGDIQTVVRGDEIHIARAIRIRTALGEPDPDPAAGGWGQLRGVVPFEQEGKALTFNATFGLLKEDDGVFSYRLFSTEFGQTTSYIEAVAIPLPPAVGMGAAGLIAAAVGAFRLRRRAIQISTT